MESRRCGEGDDDDDNGDILPECILIDILARLPLKTIFMSTCVSKRWNSLISCDDPFLAQSYLSRRISKSSSSLLMPWTFLHRYGKSFCKKKYPDNMKLSRLCCDDYKSPTLSVVEFPLSARQQHQDFPDECFILASSNGLLLCRLRCSGSSDLYVCSPLTRQWVRLPDHNPGFSSVFEGFVTHVDQGGEFVTSYKVLRLECLYPKRDRPTNLLRMDVFESETGAWRRQDVSCPRNVLITWDWIPILCNGIVHWFDERSGLIVAYDPHNNIDKCRLIKMPRMLISNMFCVSQGHLHCFLPHFNGVLVVVLKDYDHNGIWEVKHHIKWDGIHTRAFALHPFDSGVLYVSRKNQIFSYDTRSQSLELIVDSASIVSEKGFNLHGPLPFVLPLWPPSVPLPSLEAF